MAQILTLAMLSSTPAAGAVEVAAVRARLPELSLPLQIPQGDAAVKAHMLTAPEAQAVLFEPLRRLKSQRPDAQLLEPDDDWFDAALVKARLSARGNDEEELAQINDAGLVLRVHPVGQVSSKQGVLALWAVVEQQLQGKAVKVVALWLGPDGALRDAVRVGLTGGNVGASWSSQATVAADRAAEVVQRRDDVSPDFPGQEAMVFVSRSRWTFGADGRFTRGPTTQERLSGQWVDRKSHERLWLFDGGDAVKAWYQSGKTPEALAVLSVRRPDRVVEVRFKSSPKKYVLTLAAEGASVGCLNPDGTRQTFTRP